MPLLCVLRTEAGERNFRHTRWQTQGDVARKKNAFDTLPKYAYHFSNSK